MADINGVPDTSEAATSADMMAALEKHASRAVQQYEMLAKQINKLSSKGENTMADIMTPTIPMMVGGSGDGLFGGGAGGGGLIGGLILGSLLRQGNGGLFGGGDAGSASAVLRSPPEQSQANMSLMQAIGAVDKSVALGTATTETSNAVQTGTLGAAVAGSTAASMSAIQSLKDVINSNAMVLMQGQNSLQQNVMENRYELAKEVNNDGDKTRALITAQYEASLNRQLSDANAQVIALQTRFEGAERGRGIEVTNTNNINQMQQQQQQQAQYGQLANLIWGLGQSIRNSDSAINVGSGTQTSTPTNTNTNIR